MIHGVLRLVGFASLTFILLLSGCSDDGDTGGTGGSSGTGGDGGSGGAADVALRILVTNDDGFRADGIDAVVEALAENPANEIIVSAPDVNRSGSGDMTDCNGDDPLVGVEGETLSGFPATAVNGCPADAVNYALDNLYPADDPPDVVLSGINEGQNVGNLPPVGLLSQISGTVGAAKTAARRGVPALASSQGDGEPFDYPAGVDEVLQWLAVNRTAIAEGTLPIATIDSINIPTCRGSSIRNPLDPLPVPLGTENPNGFVLSGTQDCDAIGIDPDTDINAFFTGYVTITEVPAE
ncbi:MAG: 5'/3'-nucleotidase SurE [Myxococcota bacterium]